MDPLIEHTIAFSGLKDGHHAFTFELGNDFFSATGMEDLMGGKALAEVDLDKSEHLLIANIRVEGHVTVPCDHCNSPMQQPVHGSQRQIFKLTAEPGEEDEEELVALDLHAHEVNLTHYLFECVSLNLPIRHVHPPGQCDPDVEAALEKIKIDHEPVPDPRWDALKALKTKKKP